MLHLVVCQYNTKEVCSNDIKACSNDSLHLSYTHWWSTDRYGALQN